MDQFSDIRPYLDHEIRPVLDGLIENSEFIDSIARFNYPRLTRMFPPLIHALAKKRLVAQLKNVNSVATMQDIIAVYMDKMIHKTTTQLTQSGIENLRPERNYLFISNHRDIAMDPAFINYMLYHNGFETLQIAIGDNLLKKPFVTDLMRLNKSFIVRRSLKGRELLKALDHLSRYIHFCIENDQNVWIAQREGRAKNGVDRTDPALIKMLARGKKDILLGDSIASLHIVPVAISYEYDACDGLKAEELFQVATTGNFVKTDASDIQSIVTGITGFKGHVHIAFGTEFNAPLSDDPDVIAKLIDQQIARLYQLQDNSYLALQMLRDQKLEEIPELDREAWNHSISASSRETFQNHITKIDQRLHKQLLAMYANPVITRYRLD
ncbi:MAG: 1-acyl-sn-glycerol-3-phosphate acyltransferase [Pseudohongiellaceae bacterium]